MAYQGDMPLRPEIVDGLGLFLERLRGMSLVNRWNFHPRVKEQSVADHSFWVAMYTYILILIHNFKAMDVDQLDLGKGLRHALLHDMDESITCDLPYLVKRVINKTWFMLQQEALKQMVGQLPTPMQNCIVRDYVGDETIIKIVKAADLLDVIRYARAELELGNKAFITIYHETITRLYDMNLKAVDLLLASWGIERPTIETKVPDDMTHL